MQPSLAGSHRQGLPMTTAADISNQPYILMNKLSMTGAILVPNPRGTRFPSQRRVRDNVRREPLWVRVTWMAMVRLNYLAPDIQQPLSH
jgi:hypothetical protein